MFGTEFKEKEFYIEIFLKGNYVQGNLKKSHFLFMFTHTKILKESKQKLNNPTKKD
jgi:hypothetical protein